MADMGRGVGLVEPGLVSSDRNDSRNSVQPDGSLDRERDGAGKRKVGRGGVSPALMVVRFNRLTGLKIFCVWGRDDEMNQSLPRR